MIEVSVVIPCLNEEETIASCIRKAMAAFQKSNISGEVVVCDNGSIDKSVEIAVSLGARVVHQPKKGYGNAYLKGIGSAEGRYIVMGDADDTYDFSEIDRFIGPLRSGAEMVIGSRLKGHIHKGAMPFLHRYVGNPMLSALLNMMFKAKVSDTHCGMRAFKKETFRKLCLKSPGMEFASEMIIKAAKAGLKIAEVPIAYHPRKGSSKLRTFRDGWRHLRFMLLFSPEYLFILPGSIMFGFGLLSLIALVNGPISIFRHNFDLHMMILSSFFAVSGLQIFTLGLFTQIYSHELFRTENKFIEWFIKYFTLERGIYAGVFFSLIGFICCVKVFYNYLHGIISDPRYYDARLAVFGVTMMITGMQILFSSFYISFLSIKQEHEDFNNLS